MSYDEEQQRRSRVVVDTPTARREVEYQQTRYVPERSGYSTGVLVAVALTAIAATAIIFLFLMNSGDEETNVNVSTRVPATQGTPLLVQQTTPLPTPFPTLPTPPPTVTQTAPVITVPPDASIPPATTTNTAPAAAPTPNVPDEGVIKNNVNSKIDADPDLSATDILADVRNGKVTLTGRVPTPDLKRRAERLAFSVRGVRLVDNQITVTGGDGPDAGTTP